MLLSTQRIASSFFSFSCTLLEKQHLQLSRNDLHTLHRRANDDEASQPFGGFCVIWHARAGASSGAVPGSMVL